MMAAWEYIAIAYQGRAHIALGYATWDEYVDDRLSDLSADSAPRAARSGGPIAVAGTDVAAAIAKVLGVDPATVHRALGANAPSGADDADEPVPIRGRDGKSYSRHRRQQPSRACSILR